jgi:hypothetical protein
MASRDGTSTTPHDNRPLILRSQLLELLARLSGAVLVIGGLAIAASPSLSRGLVAICVGGATILIAVLLVARYRHTVRHLPDLEREVIEP